jgi:hypothetical protein
MEFFNELTGDELLGVTEAHLPEHRERLYPPTVTLAMFLRQALDADPSCQRAVNGWAAARAHEGLTVPSVRTGAYCRARARLPTSMVQGLTRASGRALSRRADPRWGWRGRRVRLLDGTGVSMPDAPWSGWRTAFGRLDDPAVLFACIAAVRVGHRHGRHEPRARKRRPKPYPWLKVPREEARRRNPAQPTWRRVRPERGCAE